MMFTRNSEVLDVLLRVAADPRVSWRAVALAGRGIVAEAAGVMWVADVGKSSLGGDGLAEFLIEQGEQIDRLSQMWQSFDEGILSKDGVEVILEEIVVKLEGAASGPVV